MSRKKVTTKRQQTPRADLRKQLADHLAAVLANPETPAPLYNAIADEICDMSSEVDWNSHEMIVTTLNGYAAREAKRTGGAR